mgnify:FL=1
MFKPVNNKVEFPKMEEDVLKLWQEKDIYEKSIEQRPADNEYVFYDGPPFATGLPHFGHFVPGTIKDAIPRYQSMKGKRVIRRFGWDCHGLPVESEMEKTIGVSGHANIINYGVAKFNEECRSIVLRYTAEWKKAITRMGRWVDFDNGYRTMDKKYMESVWWAFKTLYDKGLIYEGYNVLPYSPKLASPLSNMEVNLGGYKDVTDPAVTVRFKADGEENTYFLAWTTTPWTLPSNLALAVGADIDYVKVQDEEGGEYYYLAEKLLNKYYKDGKGMKVVERVKGNDLVGKSYEPLFPYFADLKKVGAFQVVTADYVTTEDGCGIVHTASGFGVDDYNTMKTKLPSVPVVCPIDEECKFTSEVSDFAGMFVKDADKPIIQMLKEQGKLVKKENYLHSYPFCYRTGMPLIYRAMSCWFVDVPKIKEAMLKANDQITWVPEHIKYGRFGKWLEGAREWAISRNRFWGNPIPVWKCDGSDYIEVIGSVAELEEKCGHKVEDLHKHFVDELTWPSPDGKGTMRRVPDILDCWFESGSMPYAQQHYPFENKEKFEKELFPADFINEGLDQTRGWFYSLTVLSAALFDKPAFEHCIVSGIVLAEDGRKMSKSLRNYTDPMLVVEKYGADALRFALLNSPLVKADDLKFSEDIVKDVIKELLLPLWNAYSFFITYANIDGYNPDKTNFNDLKNPLDRWIISDLEKLVKDETDGYESYDMQKTASALVSFLDDLNNWYIRRSRRRFWRSENDSDKKEAYDTLYRVLLTFVKLACPIVPFITETIYQNLKTSDMPESVHLCDYPVYNAKERDENLEKEMRLIVKTIEMGRSLRSASNLKIRQPLKSYIIVDRNSFDRAILEKNKEIIAEELNVKQVDIQSDESSLVSYSAKANFKVLGSKLGKSMKEVASIIQDFDNNKIEKLLEGEKAKIVYSAGEIDIDENDLVIQRTEKEHVKVLNDGEITVGFDTEITKELLLEGVARDLIRFVQTVRKDSGFDVSDHIVLTIDGSDTIKEAVEMYSSYIKSETLANELSISENNGSEGEIGDDKFRVDVKKAK